MKIQYLGTAAAEGVPAIFCDCDTCKKSAVAGGRNIRTRSQAIIDDTLLIDFPADTYMHMLAYDVKMSKIHTCLITHDHEDHLYELEFIHRTTDYVFTEDNTPLTVYATHPAHEKLTNTLTTERLNIKGIVNLEQISAFHSFEADGYTITPLKADHDPNCEPVFFEIKKGKKAILYAHDTGIFPEETWQFLEKSDTKYDLVSLDCTFGARKFEHLHMGLSSNIAVRDRLKKLELVDENTIFVLNHFTHNAHITYDEFCPIAEKEGFIVSYDGMCVEA